jgi:hypothetical protein
VKPPVKREYRPQRYQVYPMVPIAR